MRAREREKTKEVGKKHTTPRTHHCRYDTHDLYGNVYIQVVRAKMWIVCCRWCKMRMTRPTMTCLHKMSFGIYKKMLFVVLHRGTHQKRIQCLELARVFLETSYKSKTMSLTIERNEIFYITTASSGSGYTFMAPKKKNGFNTNTLAHVSCNVQTERCE